MNSKTAPVPSVVYFGGRPYDLDGNGYSAKLDAYVLRDRNGKLVTIPAS